MNLEERIQELEKENAELKRELDERHKQKRWSRIILDTLIWRTVVLIMFLKILDKISE